MEETCTHEELELFEEWDDGWKIKIYCPKCGKDSGWDNGYLINTYKLVKRS